jgi:hypothetical protein
MQDSNPLLLMTKTNEDSKAMLPVYYVSWEESERGWGTRPDGCSLHLTLDDFRSYEANHWKTMEKAYGQYAPDEYSRPAGRPVMAYVSRDIYDKIKASTSGIQLSYHQEAEAEKSKDIVYGSERSGWIRGDPRGR